MTSAEPVAAPPRRPIPRAAARLKVFRPVWLDTADGRHRAHVLNLSAIGACLHARCALRVWSGVTLHGDGHAMPARVTWSDGERCGVKFVRTLTSAELDALTG